MRRLSSIDLGFGLAFAVAGVLLLAIEHDALDVSPTLVVPLGLVVVGLVLFLSGLRRR